MVVAGLSALNGSAEAAVIKLRDIPPSEGLPAVVVIDRSAFNRNCIVASLADALPAILSFDCVADVPEGIGAPIVLLFADDDDGDTLDAELAAATQRWPRGTTVLLLGNGARGFELTPDRRGALDAILADSLPADMLAAAIRLAHHDHVVAPRRLWPRDGARIRIDGLALDRIAAAHPLLVHSTARQRQVMQLLVIGLPNKVIAERLLISESTVKAHIRAIMEMLGAENRTQIVARMMQLHDDTAKPDKRGRE
ncbi:DNA-binding response regulator [Sphingomonas koreensis]|nr:DNA-binding response regulator [Sphingomonas koreensis]